MRFIFFFDCKDKKWKIISGLFIFIGIGFILYGLVSHMSFIRFKTHAECVTATIVEIYEDEVYVEFETNGTIVRTRSDYYTTNMRPGQKRTYYYNPLDPTLIKSNHLLFDLTFCFVGIFHSIIGFLILFWDKKNTRNISWLIRNGKLLRLKITDFHIVNKMPNDPRHPVILEVTYTDEHEHTHTFYSEEMFMYDREWLLKQYVTIYVDPENYKNYHMDLNTLSES